MGEVWKDVTGFEGLYQVSDLGRVRRDEKILSPAKSEDDYLQVVLCKNGYMATSFVHRLVAVAFLPNPNDLPVVNHKDENPGNNHASNLEWCTRRYNTNYGTALLRRTKAQSIPVVQLLNGAVVRTWDSMADAQRAGFHAGCISLCCRGQRPTHRGYEWQFAT